MFNRHQRRADMPLFCKENIVSPDGCAGAHRFKPDALCGKGVTDRPGWSLNFETGSQEQELDRGRCVKYRAKILHYQRLVRLPCENAGGQDKDCALMRHAGKAKPAIAIGIDGRSPRIVWNQGLAAALAALAFALSLTVSRLVPSRMSTGEAMKIDE